MKENSFFKTSKTMAAQLADVVFYTKEEKTKLEYLIKLLLKVFFFCCCVVLLGHCSLCPQCKRVGKEMSWRLVCTDR